MRKLFKGGNYMRKYGSRLVPEAAEGPKIWGSNSPTIIDYRFLFNPVLLSIPAKPRVGVMSPLTTMLPPLLGT